MQDDAVVRPFSFARSDSSARRWPSASSDHYARNEVQPVRRNWIAAVDRSRRGAVRNAVLLAMPAGHAAGIAGRNRRVGLVPLWASRSPGPNAVNACPHRRGLVTATVVAAGQPGLGDIGPQLVERLVRGRRGEPHRTRPSGAGWPDDPHHRDRVAFFTSPSELTRRAIDSKATTPDPSCREPEQAGEDGADDLLLGVLLSGSTPAG